jgi:hypothetical protein
MSGPESPDGRTCTQHNGSVRLRRVDHVPPGHKPRPRNGAWVGRPPQWPHPRPGPGGYHTPRHSAMELCAHKPDGPDSDHNLIEHSTDNTDGQIYSNQHEICPCNKFGFHPLRSGSLYQRHHSRALQTNALFLHPSQRLNLFRSTPDSRSHPSPHFALRVHSFPPILPYHPEQPSYVLSPTEQHSEISGALGCMQPVRRPLS